MNRIEGQKNAGLNVHRLLRFTVYGIIILGIALRLCIYFQNRNLFQDEANVARNIYERDYLQLLQPISYAQYAPPLFLWFVKSLTFCFGFSEYILKIDALLCSIISLFLLYGLLKKFGVRYTAVYPMFLISTGFIYLNYATELKQYSSDGMVALALIYATVSIDIRVCQPMRFGPFWCLAGSIAIWSSMPAIFILAGIGCYYAAVTISGRAYNRFTILVLVALIWAAQFLFYYITLLEPQSQAGALQSAHRDNFLVFLPRTMADVHYDLNVYINVLSVTAGKWALSIIFHSLLIVVAFYYSIRRRSTQMLLLWLPIALVLIAAGLHRFALTPRLILFMLYLLLVVLAVGFEQLIQLPYIALRGTLLIVSIICLINFSEIKYFCKKMEQEQITDSFIFLQQHHLSGEHLLVHHFAWPAYVYYTTIHPDSMQWQDLRGSHSVGDDSDFKALGTSLPSGTAMLYCWQEPEIIAREQSAINSQIKTVSSYMTTGSRVYIYGR